MDHCAVCGMKIIDANTALCANHFQAYRKVKDAHSIWFVAYGNLTIEDFLRRLVALPETGDRAKEIAQFLIHNPERWE